MGVVQHASIEKIAANESILVVVFVIKRCIRELSYNFYNSVHVTSVADT